MSICLELLVQLWFRSNGRLLKSQTNRNIKIINKHIHIIEVEKLHSSQFPFWLQKHCKLALRAHHYFNTFSWCFTTCTPRVHYLYLFILCHSVCITFHSFQNVFNTFHSAFPLFLIMITICHSVAMLSLNTFHYFQNDFNTFHSFSLLFVMFKV